MWRYEDWVVKDDFFVLTAGTYCPCDIDRFASFKNTNLVRNNPGTEGIVCFSFPWNGVNNWLAPFIALISICVLHFIECKTYGSILIPKWPSSYFFAFVL